MAEIQYSEVPQIRALMSRHLDRPMDFADATLVYLAKRESMSTIFTVDHADFETYRIGRRGARQFPGFLFSPILGPLKITSLLSAFPG